MPDAISGGGQTNPLAGQSTVDPALLQRPDPFGQDMFLKLMVAQLKYQNPASPMDSSEFMSQTAQFTTVEKLTELTDKLSTSLDNDRLATATGMIGRQVTFTGLSGQPETDVVGSVRFTAMGPVLLMRGGGEVDLAHITEVAASA